MVSFMMLISLAVLITLLMWLARTAGANGGSDSRSTGNPTPPADEERATRYADDDISHGDVARRGEPAQTTNRS
jgi:hypothetical protein